MDLTIGRTSLICCSTSPVMLRDTTAKGKFCDKNSNVGKMLTKVYIMSIQDYKNTVKLPLKHKGLLQLTTHKLSLARRLLISNLVFVLR